MSLIKLCYHSSPFLRALNEVISSLGLKNVFNPSHIILGDKCIIALRAYGKKKQKPFSAYVIIYDLKLRTFVLQDLSDELSKYGAKVVADPKLFEIEGVVWATFNTGYHKVQNEIYIVSIYPKQSKPLKCYYSNRAKIEKNWGFYIDGKYLKTIYSVTPLIIIRTPLNELYSSVESIEFELEYAQASELIKSSDLSIGTQPVLVGKEMFLICHKKFSLFGKRLYLGTPVKISFDISTKPQVICYKTNLTFSLLSLLGSFPKHNKNLISCTYFSGLSIIGNVGFVAFGINDVTYGFSEIQLDDLWI